MSAPWWKTAVVYQIYPASFKDSNGDGLGDIPGIISKVDYIASLGVDAVWLSPCYKSPQVDMGYDISDYRDIHEPYGSVADVEHLIAELGKKKIKLLMDLVINHTSEEHPWFLESKSSLNNPKRDWFIWRKGKTAPDGSKLPPNNWESIFKGSVWEYDESTDEYYFHIFAKEQPDLNWENSDVREALAADMHFWLEKGLGGFRVDAINLISKPADFPDAPITHPGPNQSCTSIIYNRAEVHEWLKEIKANVIDHYPDLVTVGECGGTNDLAEVLKYIHPDRKELDMIFQFEIMDHDIGPLGVFSAREWKLSDIKNVTEKWQTVLRPAWNTWQLENHDSGRSVNRFGRAPSSDLLPAVSRLLAFYLMTLGGTVFLHQGQEIGAPNLTEDVPIEDYMDLATHSEISNIRSNRVLTTGTEDVDMSDVMREVLQRARDHARVPMAWDGTASAGFSTGKPWMTLGTTYKRINVKDQEGTEGSVLNTWRDMIKLRKEHAEELVFGGFEVVDKEHEQVFAYMRPAVGGGSKILVALNWSAENVSWTNPMAGQGGKVVKVVGTVEEREGEKKVRMSPYACVAWKL